MDKLKNYDVGFSGLKNGKHHFRFKIDKTFFQLFDTEQEFSDPKITADIALDKHSTFLEFIIKTCGNVELICDITNKLFRYEIENEIKILVKFGEDFDDSDENVITIPMSNHAFNVAQLIYEDVMLSIPMKKISPEISDDDLEILEKFSPKIEEKEQETDSRWDVLKKLL
ncbi:MAG: DUF177 domain-containing protein [Flavobacteriaceae bacterium]|jgi:uncharacterized metal-binding protein YceD (DUF177 family)|nr:DUF177 domain-containing protein [Flavobacteriaceae bacterium]